MKNKKVLKEVKYNGFGFPVLLKNVPAKKIRGQLEPLVNYKQLGAQVVLALALKPTPLTGAQVKFIRLYFDLSYREFAGLFGMTHPAVLKWEAFGDHHANISPGIEKSLRLEAVFRLGLKPSEFYKLFEQLRGLATTLRNTEGQTEAPLKLAV